MPAVMPDPTREARRLDHARIARRKAQCHERDAEAEHQVPAQLRARDNDPLQFLSQPLRSDEGRDVWTMKKANMIGLVEADPPGSANAPAAIAP